MKYDDVKNNNKKTEMGIDKWISGIEYITRN